MVVTSYDIQSYKLSDKVTKVQFEEPILGFADFSNQENTVVVICKSEIAILAFVGSGSSINVKETASLPFKEVEKELLQIVVVPQDSTFTDIVVLHDEY